MPQQTASFTPFIYPRCLPTLPPLSSPSFPSLLDYSERPLPHPPTLTPNWLEYQSMRHSGWPCWNFRKLTIHSLEMVIWKAGKAVATTLQRIWAKGYTGSSGRRAIRQFNFQLLRHVAVIQVVSRRIRRNLSYWSYIARTRSYRWEISFAQSDYRIVAQENSDKLFR